MATYLALDVIFLAIIVVLLWRYRPAVNRTLWVTLAVLLLLTAIFDNLIVYFDIVGYAQDKILGIYLVFAPIEDFFYALAAVAIVPALWKKYGGEHANRR